VLAAVFVAAGVMHFVGPAAYVGIMPPWLPYPLALVYVSGAAEIAGGIGVLLPQPIRRLAGWGLVLLLAAVFPANVEMALRGATIAGHVVPPHAVGSWLRLPVQAVLIWWVVGATGIGGRRGAAQE